METIIHTKEECFQGWARIGLNTLNYLKTYPNNYKALVTVKTAAA